MDIYVNMWYDIILDSKMIIHIMYFMMHTIQLFIYIVFTIQNIL